MDVVRGRLAPSPTGGLHVGNVRTLMLAWLSARAVGGSVVLRIEDIDQARCKPGFAEQMVDDLRWLGFDWDEGPDTGGPYAPYEQSARLGHYRDALERLVARRYAYPCICSRADLAAAASAPHGADGPVYPGTCRDRFRDAREAEKVAGRPPAWRFDSRCAPQLQWRDAFSPERAVPHAVDDFVLWRTDGVPSYQIAVVVDDLAMRITEVVRGDDLMDSTPRQLALIRALGGEAPAYRHVPLVLDEEGRRLAKRSGATQIAELRRLGVRAEQVLGLLASGAGLAGSAEPVALHGLISGFNWRRVPVAPLALTDATLRSLAPAVVRAPTEQ
jgi:glutamyl-tRNA synthetase